MNNRSSGDQGSVTHRRRYAAIAASALAAPLLGLALSASPRQTPAAEAAVAQSTQSTVSTTIPAREIDASQSFELSETWQAGACTASFWIVGLDFGGSRLTAASLTFDDPSACRGYVSLDDRWENKEDHGDSPRRITQYMVGRPDSATIYIADESGSFELEEFFLRS